MRIGVAGLAGRMGVQVARHVASSGAQLVGGTVRPGSEKMPVAPVFADFGALADACDVIIDFTQPATVAAHAAACAQAGVAWILGTTGLTDTDQQAVLEASASSAIVQAANFAPGMVLVQALARQLGAALRAETHDAEIIEMHHRQKRDAPSGTALALGRAVAAGRCVDFGSVATLGHTGVAGARPEGAIGFAAVRGGQVVGDHSVMFAADDEQIVLTHRALDRGIFAAGAVRAALWVAGRGPGLYSMMDVLGIDEK
jgi:4-hydroxy-tetrahydrodipicolinate reductase